MVIALVLIPALIGAIWAQFNPSLSPGHMTLIIGAGDVVRPRFPRFLWLPIWPAAAVGFLYLEGALVRWTGGLLGGTANTIEVRAALAWPEVITIAAALAYMATGMVSPLDLLMAPAGLERHLAQSVWLASVALGVPLFVWHFVVLVACIGEVHRFSFWKGLGAWLMAMCSLLVALFAANTIAALLIRL